MENKKNIILIGIIAVLTIYLVFSKTNSSKEIKQLTRKIEEQVDSLSNLSSKYNLLKLNYDSIFQDLTVTTNQIKNFKHDIDSIMNGNINSVSKMENALGKVLDQQKEYDRMDTVTNDNWRF